MTCPGNRPTGQRGISLIGLLPWLLIIAAAAAGWWGWQQFVALQQQQQQLTAQLASLRDASQQPDPTLSARIDTLAEDLQQSLARQQQLSAELAPRGKRHWLLEDAAALASLASQRLTLSADSDAAIALLEAADSALAQLNDPATLPARAALATDIEALRAAAQTDITALVLRLGALHEQVNQLTSKPLPQMDQEPADAATDGWARLWQSLPIRITDNASQPILLDARQAASARLALHTLLHQAQLALLQRRGAVYQQALTQMNALIDQLYRPEDARAAALLAALERLQTTPTEAALPQIGTGLHAIRALQAEAAQ